VPEIYSREQRAEQPRPRKRGIIWATKKTLDHRGRDRAITRNQGIRNRNGLILGRRDRTCRKNRNPGLAKEPRLAAL